MKTTNLLFVVLCMVLPVAELLMRAPLRRKFIRLSITRLLSSLKDPTKDVLPSPSYSNFNFKIDCNSEQCKARTGIISTPHGEIETPNFIFCATKAAMKSMTTAQIREEGSQIILSNTFHLMLTPGADLIEKLGGLQKITGWNGPMLTDSGGYQIFSMGHGSVAEEIKGKRNHEGLGLNKTLLRIDENGATFRSFIDGSIHSLSPEKSIQIQQKLGADLIVVLDECTPFHVDKKYTEDSMHRSHRWGDRCIREFSRIDRGKQALYGIVQGGVYEDLRRVSTDYVNTRPFFGIAIGGSLGATKKEMHQIVAFTRALLRNDRPVHLLGIGGIRDIFHGVRQGIDTFDCVHPTRLGRHGGALVKANHWKEEKWAEESLTSNSFFMGLVNKYETIKKQSEPLLAEISAKRALYSGVSEFSEEAKAQLKSLDSQEQRILRKLENYEKKINKQRKLVEGPARDDGGSDRRVTVREHIHLEKSQFRSDPRPIDPECTCYSCRTFSRGYLHHLFRAKEMLGPTLVSIHNVHFMNEMMRKIREGIRNQRLEEVEREYVHSDLIASVGRTTAVGE